MVNKMITMKKATIKDIDGEKSISCQFNPTDLSLSKSSSWQSGSESQQSTSKQEFGGNNPISLKVKLLFDTYGGYDTTGKPGNAGPSNVTTYTIQLWDLLEPKYEINPKTKNGRPARVKFMWGGFILPYEFFVENISEQITLFTPDGIPVRSTVDLSLKEIHSKDYDAKKAALAAGSVSLPSYGARAQFMQSPSVYVAQSDDTLAKIAHTQLGDASRWREVATSNNVKNTRDIKSGTPFKISRD
jgi:nucleoid-associated protein YgaU